MVRLFKFVNVRDRRLLSVFLFTFITFLCRSTTELIAVDREVGIGGATIVYPLLTPRLSSKYGTRKHPVRKAIRHHSGVDLAAPKSSHVRSIAHGLVIYAGWLPGYGNTVTVRHDNRHASLYGHLDSTLVKVGERVPAGKIIGRVGSTGLATGPHLHFEWRDEGKPIDPMKFFPQLASKPKG